MQSENQEKNERIGLFGRLKGKDSIDTIHNYSIAGIILSGVFFAIGVAATGFQTAGTPAIIAMLGAFFSFVFTLILLGTWFVKEALNK